MSERTHSTRYAEAVESFIEFARTLTDEEWATQVPCTPLWTARDVLSHVAGLPDDGIAGRMEGGPGRGLGPSRRSSATPNSPWTSCSRDSAVSTASSVRCWTRSVRGGHRSTATPHEHDIRHAVGRPGNRDSAIIDDTSATLPTTLGDLLVRLTITYEDGTVYEVGAVDATGRSERCRSRSSTCSGPVWVAARSHRSVASNWGR